MEPLAPFPDTLNPRLPTRNPKPQTPALHQARGMQPSWEVVFVIRLNFDDPAAPQRGWAWGHFQALDRGGCCELRGVRTPKPRNFETSKSRNPEILKP